MITTASLISRITGDLTQPVKRGFDADGADRWQAVLKSIEERVRKVGAKEDTTLKNTHLSQDGQRQQLTVLGNESGPDFAGPSRVINDIDEADARITTLLFGPILKRPKDGNETIQFLREQEIRQAIGKTEANVQLLSALERGDLETARALLDAPGGSWVSDEIRRRGEESFAIRTNPEAYKKHQAIGVLREHLVSLRDMITQWLIGGLGADPSIVEKALKG